MREIQRNQEIEAEITITCKNLNQFKTKTFLLTTRSWDQQTPDDKIDIEFDFVELASFFVDFEISVRSNKPTPILFFCPDVSPSNVYTLLSKHQQIVGTDFDKQNQWYNLPLLDNQTAQIKLELFKLHDTLDDAVDFVKNKYSL